MEIHVHTPATLWEVSERRARTERITRLPHMFTIGEMVFDRDGTGGNLKSRLTDLMVKGPAPMNDSELVLYRHRISDGIADLSDPRPLGEVMFSSAKLARSIAEFVLARNKHWLSTGKALHRNLRQVEPELAERLADGHIGLATQRVRVEAAGGHMDVTSEPGTGTRVAIRLPTAG